MDQLLIPVLMCGGAGTRLWPLSRESMPKQFTPLVGGRSTFQQVLDRTAAPDLFDRPIVITNQDFRFVVAEQLREMGVAADIVLEPARRDSGPAVAVAAALAAERDPKAIVLVLAADHVVRKPEQFRAGLPRCRRGGARGPDRDLRHHAGSSGRQLRLHPPGTAARRRYGVRGRGVCREAGRRQARPAMWRRTISGTAATSCSAPT